jgi:hypothetical protein
VPPFRLQSELVLPWRKPWTRAIFKVGARAVFDFARMQPEMNKFHGPANEVRPCSTLLRRRVSLALKLAKPAYELGILIR